MNRFLIMLSCLGLASAAVAQQGDMMVDKEHVVIKDGIWVSYAGVDLSTYEIDVEMFDPDKVPLNYLLCLAVEECDAVFTKKLIERGVDVNFKCEEANEVITGVAFCHKNGVALAKLLLDEGANINGADEDNDPFLSYAIAFDNLDLVKFLIEKGANKAHRDANKNMGCLPIHGVESVEMLELLLANEFLVDEQCSNGRTLLHFAAKENLREIAEFLLEKKLIDISKKDKNGATALDYAKRFKHSEIAELIRRYK